MIKEVRLLRQDDKIVLSQLEGRSVDRCCVDYAFGMEFYWNEEDIIIRIGTRFRLRDKQRDWKVSPQTLEGVGEAIAVSRKTVNQAIAFENGSLELYFTDGAILSVSPDPDYEAWEVSSSSGLRLVSLPGGGLAIWNPERS